MPIYNTLEEALAEQPTMRHSLLPDSPTPSRSDSSISLDKQYQMVKMPLNIPRPTLYRNFCGGSGSIHDLSPVTEESNPVEMIELQDLQPADHPDAGHRVPTDKGEENVKNEKKTTILRKRQTWFKIGEAGKAEMQVRANEVERQRQSWMLKCGGSWTPVG